MDSQPYRIQFDLQRRRTFYNRVAAVNLVLAGTTALCIALWALWARSDEMQLEEGGLELFGILFFIAGVLTYLDRALYGYVDRLALSAPWQLPLVGVLAAGGTLELVLGYYRFSLSPISSIASPTLRRPRPNPS